MKNENMKWWFIEYETPEWKHCYIVVNCNDRSEARKWLKKHLNNARHKINRIEEAKGQNAQ